MKLKLNTLPTIISALLIVIVMFCALPAQVLASGSTGYYSDGKHSSKDFFNKSQAKKSSGKSCPKNTCDNALSVPLYVEGGKRVGKVTVRLEGGDLKVRYEVNEGWHIQQTHLDLADSYNGLHVNADGTPKVEAFPYQSKHFLPVKSVDHTISAAQWPLQTELYVAAQAIVVSEQNGKCVHHTAKSHHDKDSKQHSNKKSHGKNTKETGHAVKHHDGNHKHEKDNIAAKDAWAVGQQFPGQTLAAYFTYKLESCEPVQQSSVQFSDALYITNEGDMQAVISVVRTGNLEQTSSVQFTTLDGSAVNGADYEFAGGNLTFAPGQTNAQFTITLIEDLEVESVETIGLQLSNPIGATLGQQNTATLEIEDNDVLPVTSVEFSQAEFVYLERTPVAIITVVRSGDVNNEVQVDFATADGSAVEVLDYVGNSGTLIIPPGVITATFEVRIINDRAGESDETVLLSLSNPVGADLGAQQSATLIIQDDDGGPN